MLKNFFLCVFFFPSLFLWPPTFRNLERKRCSEIKSYQNALEKSTLLQFQYLLVAICIPSDSLPCGSGLSIKKHGSTGSVHAAIWHIQHMKHIQICSLRSHSASSKQIIFKVGFSLLRQENALLHSAFNY